jgi:hypothetical protein
MKLSLAFFHKKGRKPERTRSWYLLCNSYVIEKDEACTKSWNVTFAWRMPKGWWSSEEKAEFKKCNTSFNQKKCWNYLIFPSPHHPILTPGSYRLQLLLIQWTGSLLPVPGWGVEFHSHPLKYVRIIRLEKFCSFVPEHQRGLNSKRGLSCFPPPRPFDSKRKIFRSIRVKKLSQT